jgi:hypothetical protein
MTSPNGSTHSQGEPGVIYGLDRHGTHWYWNCGWRCLENSTLIFTHALWRKSIAPNIVSWTEVIKPKPRRTDPEYHPRNRPYDTWRRAEEKLYEHPLYGEVVMKETDGIHAIVRNLVRDIETFEVVEDTAVEVHLANLTIVVTRPSGTSSTPRQPKWGDLKPFIPQARSYFKDQGIKPTDDELREIAQLFKTSIENLFKIK